VTTTVLAYIPSPSQGVWYLGPFPIRAYALFIIIGLVVALLIGDRRWEARGGERGVIYDISLWAVPFGLIGGRLYHVITDWPKYFGDGGAGVWGALRIWDGGLGIWGAVALGGVGAWIACRLRGIPLPAFGDAIAPGISLAQAIGRLGNYFNQELYGRPTTLPWGLEIYERRNASGVVSPDLANGVSTGQLDSIVHPTFLYELLWNLLVFAVLIWVDRKFKIGHGRLFALYVAGYCLGRFWIELLRSDVASMPVEGIRVNSFTSTFVFIGAVVYIMVAPKGREDPAALKGKAVDAEHEDSGVEEFVKELSAVGAASGVVAAAKVAGQAEDEDAKAAGEESGGEEPKSEAADDAQEAEEAAEGEEAEDSADAEGEEAEASADAEGEEAEPEAVAEGEEVEPEASAEEMGADVAGVPADSVAEAEELAAEGEESEQVDGVDVVEGEAEAEGSAEEVGGVGAVEAEEAAPEVHEAAVEAAEEAEEFAAEVAEESDAEEPVTEDAEEAVEQSAQATPSGDAEAIEAAVDAAEAADANEAERQPVDTETPEAALTAAEPTDESGGRLRRWLRRR
jgi:prolipoprotein diacylglyceryl transferase